MSTIGEMPDTQVAAFEDSLNKIYGTEQTQAQETPAATTTPAQEQTEDLRKILETEGFDLSGKDNREVATLFKTRLSESEELKRQLEAERRQAQELRAYLEQQKLQQPKQEEAPATAPATAKEQKEAVKKWAEVQIDPVLEQLCERDQSGMYTPKANFGAAAIEAANNLNGAIRERARRVELFINNPSLALAEAGIEESFQERIRALVDDKIEKLKADQAAAYKQAMEEYNAQARTAQIQDEGERFYQENKAKFFYLDANQNPIIDPLSGAPRLTEKGQKFQEICKGLIEDGMDQAHAIKRSAVLVEQLFTTAQTPPTREEKQRAFLDKDLANRQPDVPSPSRQPADEEFPQNMSLKDLFLRDPANAEMLGPNYLGR